MPQAPNLCAYDSMKVAFRVYVRDWGEGLVSCICAFVCDGSEGWVSRGLVLARWQSWRLRMRRRGSKTGCWEGRCSRPPAIDSLRLFQLQIREEGRPPAIHSLIRVIPKTKPKTKPKPKPLLFLRLRRRRRRLLPDRPRLLLLLLLPVFRTPEFGHKQFLPCPEDCFRRPR